MSKLDGDSSGRGEPVEGAALASGQPGQSRAEKKSRNETAIGSPAGLLSARSLKWSLPLLLLGGVMLWHFWDQYQHEKAFAAACARQVWQMPAKSTLPRVPLVMQHGEVRFLICYDQCGNLLASLPVSSIVVSGRLFNSYINPALTALQQWRFVELTRPVAGRCPEGGVLTREIDRIPGSKALCATPTNTPPTAHYTLRLPAKSIPALPPQYPGMSDDPRSAELLAPTGEVLAAVGGAIYCCGGLARMLPYGLGAIFTESCPDRDPIDGTFQLLIERLGESK